MKNVLKRSISFLFAITLIFCFVYIGLNDVDFSRFFVVKTYAACDHIASDWIIDTEATCNEEGAKHKECIDCKKILKTATIRATGHDFARKVVKKATCSTDTEVKEYCKKCGVSHIFERSGDKGHKYIKITSGKNAGRCKCVQCGTVVDKIRFSSRSNDICSLNPQNYVIWSSEYHMWWDGEASATNIDFILFYMSKLCMSDEIQMLPAEFLEAKAKAYFDVSVKELRETENRFLKYNPDNNTYENIHDMSYRDGIRAGEICLEGYTKIGNRYTVYVERGEVDWGELHLGRYKCILEYVDNKPRFVATKSMNSAKFPDNLIKDHVSSNWIVDKQATVNSVGKKHKECIECGKVLETAEIARLKVSIPKLSKIENTGNSVKITWSKASDADGYYVYRKIPGVGEWKRISTIKGNTKISYKDTTVTSGKTYAYKVKAYDDSDTSPYSATVKILYLGVPKLNRIENVTSGIKVTWGKVTGATSYNVYRKVKGASSWTYLANTKSVSYTDKTAKSGTTYYYTVRAKSSTSVSAYNSDGIGTKYLAVPKISKAENLNKAIRITWTKVTGAEGYYVYRKAPGETAWKKVATIKGNAKVTYKDTKVSNNKVYTYSVKAYYGTRTSYLASSLKIRYLAAPSLTKVTSTTSGVKFTWGKVAGADGYYVYRKTGSDSWTKIATVKSGASYLDKSAKKGTTYYYTVKAFKGSRTSYYNTTGLKVTDKY